MSERIPGDHVRLEGIESNENTLAFDYYGARARIKLMGDTLDRFKAVLREETDGVCKISGGRVDGDKVYENSLKLYGVNEEDVTVEGQFSKLMTYIHLIKDPKITTVEILDS